MKTITIFLISFFAINCITNAQYKQYTLLNGNNISAYYVSSGIFDQDIRTMNTPGFEWPKGTNKHAIFTAGLCIGAYVNGQLAETMCSWSGEYAPGYVSYNEGMPVFATDARFKFYNVKKSDSYISNPDWLNWGAIVPFGAPFVDVNNNGIYEFNIDTPGVRNAEQTVYICLTDANPQSHNPGEGFGGGITDPLLFSEVHLTSWVYNTPELQDVQFIKYEVVNKNIHPWNQTYFALMSDPDIGNPIDDFIGCDTIRNLGYCYNADSNDNGGINTYGLNPPAAGFLLLHGSYNRSISVPKLLGMTSFINFAGTMHPPDCETDPNGQPLEAYTFLRGLKKNGSNYLDPTFTPPRKTKFCYYGDPETGTGWTEYQGRIMNCGVDTGSVIPCYGGDRRFILSSGADNFTVAPNEKQVIFFAQIIARGTSHLNSVTKLKQLADYVRNFYNNNLYIGINPVSANIPEKYSLQQNFPNPFNPTTVISCQLPVAGQVSLKIYDMLGREVTTLVNEKLAPGTYTFDWNASQYPSGVYFYRLSAEGFTETKSMVLLK